MSVLNDIRTMANASISKERASIIIESLITRAIKNHAKIVFDAIINDIKKAVSDSQYKMENGRKVIIGAMNIESIITIFFHMIKNYL